MPGGKYWRIICSFQSVSLRGNFQRDTSPGTKNLAGNHFLKHKNRATFGEQLIADTDIQTGFITSPIPCISVKLPFLGLSQSQHGRRFSPRPAQTPTHTLSPDNRLLWVLHFGRGGSGSHLTSRPEHTYLKLNSQARYQALLIGRIASADHCSEG